MSDDQTMFHRSRVNDTWENWHETITGTIARVDAISRPPDDLTYSTNAVKRCTKQIQRAIREAKQDGIECRAVGRGWSLSDAPLTTGAMIDIGRLNQIRKVHHMQVDPAYPGTVEQRRGLCMVQAGTYVSELNRWLEANEQKLTIQTTGAANGQTLAGATQAGTHGSVLGFGAMHDQVVALHIITGPDTEVWLERASYPVVKQSVANAYGAPLLRDDDLFNAALVGLGAFGVIHNMVIEAKPRHMFSAFNMNKDRNGQTLKLDADMRARIATLDFSTQGRLDPAGKSGTPYFYQPIINPNTPPPHEVLLTHMYEEPWDSNHPIDYAMKEASWGPGYDFVSVAGRVLNVAQFLVPLFSDLVSNALFTVGNDFGTWGELFGYKTQRTLVASGTVAVDVSDALATIDALIELNNATGPVPLVYGCRYVKKSPALLAFNRWDTTFVVSIDGIYNDDSVDFFDAIPAKMASKGITFTQHWGKTNAYDAARVRSAYGNANVNKWIAARQQLIPDPANRALFENALIRRCGLDV
ncbi:FAD-binding protein [Erythrobacter sp. THAF29]|uniref:FAD-binding protein n=1 Tax=Erythrobacter sp. THAF29 TaxID=2587851 RepID=UPI001269778B|nr:FAD-binding protein [Erythrobacter sp. THAF29]QFT76039.1 L-gulono-1,4-lactone dehydrogenase [Erythrobacter sp. THAF29]